MPFGLTIDAVPCAFQSSTRNYPTAYVGLIVVPAVLETA
jgi:hypothetical protein